MHIVIMHGLWPGSKVVDGSSGTGGLSHGFPVLQSFTIVRPRWLLALAAFVNLPTANTLYLKPPSNLASQQPIAAMEPAPDAQPHQEQEEAVSKQQMTDFFQRLRTKGLTAQMDFSCCSV